MPLYDKVFYLAFFFILGTAGAGFGINVWLGLIISAVIGASFFSLGTKSTAWCCLICLMGYFYLSLSGIIGADSILPREDAEYVGLVVTDPDAGISSKIVEIKLFSPHRGKIIIYLPLDSEVDYGDVVNFEGKARVSPHGGYVLYTPTKLKILEKSMGNTLQHSLFHLKKTAVNNLKSVLPAEKAALMAGILLGEKGEFTQELKEGMRRSGTTHLVALSGYNVAILIAVVSSLFTYFGWKRRAFWLSILIIVLFIIMTGAEPSLVRAGIMGIISLVATQRERIYSPRNAITLTALVMLLYDPNLISRDVGFQLSFVALLGLVYLYPKLKNWTGWEEGGFLNWRSSTLQTLSAQLAVMPVLIFNFGFISPVAILANVLILGAIPATMLAGFLIIIAGFIFYPLAALIALFANFLLSYEIFIIKLLAFT